MDRIWHKSYDPGVPFSREYPETCLPLILEQNARLFAGNIAADFFGYRLTYRRLWDHVLRRELRKSGSTRQPEDAAGRRSEK
jgi:hypothetical protein